MDRNRTELASTKNNKNASKDGSDIGEDPAIVFYICFLIIIVLIIFYCFLKVWDYYEKRKGNLGKDSNKMG